MPPPSRSMAASDSRSSVGGAATISTRGKTPSSWRHASETTRSGRWPGTRARDPELPSHALPWCEPTHPWRDTPHDRTPRHDYARPGRRRAGPVKGILTIKQKPVETVADARVTYIKLTPEQVEAQKRFGFASENIKVRSKLGTTFSNHGITIPQLMFLKLSNEIAIETDLTFAKQ